MVRLWSVVSIVRRPRRPLVLITVVTTDHMEIQWNEPSRYEIIRRIGGGKYSEVRQLRPPILHFPIDAGIVAPRFSKERTSSTMKPVQ